ncbi:hypothetical protein EDB81DRAFT_803226 [Dactylonectria macrodidyma]|uniref:Nephrocystin 3-like N-terminal domain-containing protein n=1 Tax=Dactylonectria macrodidyma TaxID=307937 RepID=A0A9P9EA15_9HYPO|nr:hypothetical protein EDB81DRAFT_803226 [Dactylonectria macrodidyma]
MDPLGAVLQISERIIVLCKTYIEDVRDAPSDLRAILIEISAIKSLFKNVRFLLTCDNTTTLLAGLAADSGPIEGCKRAVTELETLFPPDCLSAAKAQSKRPRVKPTLETLAWPFKKPKAKKLLEEITRYRATISLALTTDASLDIKVIRSKAIDIDTKLTDLQREKVYEWLHATDPSPLHHQARKHYEFGTGDWMLRSEEWASWIECKTRCLWIHGVPGAGKTILASHLIDAVQTFCSDEVSTQKHAFAYYYCYFGHNQNETAPFLKWTLNQLCRQADSVRPYLHKLYKRGGEPSLAELLRSLEEISEEFDCIYLVVDAIDESMERADLLAVLRELVIDARFQNIRLTATSREYVDIEKVMDDISTPMSMRNPLLDEDILLYVNSRVQRHPRLSLWPLHLRSEVCDALSRKAKGMFRWVVCQIDVLQRLRPDSTVIRDALANLPKTLDETYERLFLQIPEDGRIFVHHALRWIYYNGEIYNADIHSSTLLEAIQRSERTYFRSRNVYAYDEDLLREFCGCLITLQQHEPFHQLPARVTVSFAHYTVWEFLKSDRIWNGPAAFFGVDQKRTNLEFSKIMMLEATASQRHRRRDHLKDWTDNSRAQFKVLVLDFTVYCICSSVVSLFNWGSEMSKSADLATLAFHLLDPSEPHFERLFLPLQLASIDIDDTLKWSIRKEEEFWAYTWHQLPAIKNIAILCNLSCVDKSQKLTRHLLQKVVKEKEKIGMEQLNARISKSQLSFKNPRRCVQVHRSRKPGGLIFEGNILDVFDQFQLIVQRLGVKVDDKVDRSALTWQWSTF